MYSEKGAWFEKIHSRFSTSLMALLLKKIVLISACCSCPAGRSNLIKAESQCDLLLLRYCRKVFVKDIEQKQENVSYSHHNHIHILLHYCSFLPISLLSSVTHQLPICTYLHTVLCKIPRLNADVSCMRKMWRKEFTASTKSCSSVNFLYKRRYLILSISSCIVVVFFFFFCILFLYTTE